VPVRGADLGPDEERESLERARRYGYPVNSPAAPRRRRRAAPGPPADEPQPLPQIRILSRGAAARLRAAQHLALRWEREDPEVSMRDIVDILLQPLRLEVWVDDDGQ
jgi:hypothetical protein